MKPDFEPGWANIAIAGGILGRWMGGGAIAATVVLMAPAAFSATLTTWTFDTSSYQLFLTLPPDITPRYLVLAEPARFILEVPNTELGPVVTEQLYSSGSVRSIRLAQYDANTLRFVIELAPGTVLDPRHATLASTPTGDQTQWTFTPLIVGDGTAIAAQPTSPETALPATPTPTDGAPPPPDVVTPTPPASDPGWISTPEGQVSVSAAPLTAPLPASETAELPNTLSLDPFAPSVDPNAQVTVPPLEETLPPLSPTAAVPTTATPTTATPTTAPVTPAPAIVSPPPVTPAAISPVVSPGENAAENPPVNTGEPTTEITTSAPIPGPTTTEGEAIAPLTAEPPVLGDRAPETPPPTSEVAVALVPAGAPVAPAEIAVEPPAQSLPAPGAEPAEEVVGTGTEPAPEIAAGTPNVPFVEASPGPSGPPIAAAPPFLEAPPTPAPAVPTAPTAAIAASPAPLPPFLVEPPAVAPTPSPTPLVQEPPFLVTPPVTTGAATASTPPVITALPPGSQVPPTEPWVAPEPVPFQSAPTPAPASTAPTALRNSRAIDFGQPLPLASTQETTAPASP